jgi:hypothetical protein
LLTAIYPSDAHAFDYPFVKVDWVGQGGNARDQLIDRFHEWLTPTELKGEGFRDPSGIAGNELSYAGSFTQVQIKPSDVPSAQDLKKTRVFFGEAQRPLNAVLALDISRSMGASASGQGSKLDRARTQARTIVTLLGAAGSSDQVAIWSFPDSRSPSNPGPGKLIDPTQAQKSAQRNQLNGAIDQLATANGRSSPFYRTMFKALEAVSSDARRTPAVVMLTDADDWFRTGPGGADTKPASASKQWLDELVKKISDLHKRGVNPHIAVLTIGASTWCDSQDAKTLNVECWNGDDASTNGVSLITDVISQLRRP